MRSPDAFVKNQEASLNTTGIIITYKQRHVLSKAIFNCDTNTNKGERHSQNTDVLKKYVKLWRDSFILHEMWAHVGVCQKCES